MLGQSPIGASAIGQFWRTYFPREFNAPATRTTLVQTQSRVLLLNATKRFATS